VILPAAGYAAEAGTTTNLEGRVTRLGQKVTAPGSSRADWMIAAELAFALDDDLGVESVEDLRREIATVAPAYLGLTDEVLDDPVNVDGVVMPLPQPEPEPEIADEQNTADAETSATDADAEPPPLVVSGPSLPATVALPAAPTVATPAHDAYSHRLVVTRKLYDHGTLVSHSPAISVLATPRTLELNPADLDRLGVASGDQVKVTSPRASLVIEVTAQAGVPKGVAALVFDQADRVAARLLEPGATVTDVRVETQS
jgi:predicted molibdopterin-dependent oxidoreductase YjgC